MNHNPDHSDNLVALRRIEGQVRGVQGMIEDRKYCIDILTQIHAVKGALSRVEEKILEKHFQNCVTDAFAGSSQEEMQQKLIEIIKLLHQVRLQHPCRISVRPPETKDRHEPANSLPRRQVIPLAQLCLDLQV